MQYFIVCAILFNFINCYVNSNPTGVGGYVYQDSAGNRYDGKYDLNDPQFKNLGGIPGFAGGIPGFPGVFAGGATAVAGGVPGIFPQYFKNLQSLIPEVFADVNQQNLALNAARKAFEITSNNVFAPNFPFTDDEPDFSGFGQLPGFGNMNFGYGNPGYNSAYAGALATPDFAHQVANISPQNPGVSPLAAANPLREFADFINPHNTFNWITSHSSNTHAPNVPNVNVVNRFAESARNDGQPHYNGVSSSSYSASTNVNGKEHNQRGAETTVNKDGKVLTYKVEN